MKEKFKELQDKYPNLSSAMVFVKLIKGKGFSKNIISRHFSSLVDKDDYSGLEKRSLLKWLFEIGSK
jgi:hypothetical protein